ncbi:hypothetical protein SISNIDRAFT_461513 [Sistotremastrum niveocremeum HHB9708]|uniref:Uncharacterized protein n=1 Tax=Sistotremastrum niveocremeum HHB9708 TaxID=1314777 RepID=A0A164MJI3_9AGAM|nr:hypothetical protein SISNIDRAFT_461513 [Sistotremastrum niveocremeum HHB9708]
MHTKFPEDMWARIVPYMIDKGMKDWENAASAHVFETHNVPLHEMSSFHRSLCVIFIDAVSDYVAPFRAFREMSTFCRDPPATEQGLPETDYVPLPPFLSAEITLPTAQFAPHTCTCNQCRKQVRRFGNEKHIFRFQYAQTIEDARSRSCSALESAWEDFLFQIESWFEGETLRIESPIDPFPIFNDFERLGPAISDACTLSDVIIGGPLSAEELLRAAVTLHLLPAVQARDGPAPDVPKALTLDGVGYLVRSPEAGPVSFVTGNWLLPLASQDANNRNAKILVLPQSEECSLVTDHLDYPRAIHTLCMPSLGPPESHDLPHFEVYCSDSESDGFSLFSLFDPSKLGEYGVECLALQLSTVYHHRWIRTWWRPTIHLGRKCDHSNLHQIATRCSFTIDDILRQLDPPTELVLEEIGSFRCQKDMDYDAVCRYTDLLRETLGQQTKRLTQRGGAFQRHRAIFVRCDPEEPTESIIFLAASCNRWIYVVDYQECWDCATFEMLQKGCFVAFAFGCRVISTCNHCHS